MWLKNEPGRVVSWVVRLYANPRAWRTPGREITLYRKFNFALNQLSVSLRFEASERVRESGIIIRIEHQRVVHRIVTD